MANRHKSQAAGKSGAEALAYAGGGSKTAAGNGARVAVAGASPSVTRFGRQPASAVAVRGAGTGLVEPVRSAAASCRPGIGAARAGASVGRPGRQGKPWAGAGPCSVGRPTRAAGA